MKYVSIIFNESGKFVGYDDTLYNTLDDAHKAGIDVINASLTPNLVGKILEMQEDDR